MVNLYKTLVRIKFNNYRENSDTQTSKKSPESSYEIISPNFKNGFDENKFTNQGKNSDVFDMKIKKYCLNNKNDIDALFLLRCRTSHAILASINSIWYEHNTNVTFKDLLSLVMQDPGERYLSIKKEKRNRRIAFDYNLVEKLQRTYSIKKERIHPFSSQVIQTYESKNESSIAYWTSFLIKRDPEIVSILRPHGQRVITDWALLYDTSVSKMERSWDKYGQKEIFSSLIENYEFDHNKIKKIIKSIFINYQYHYEIAKDIYRRINRRDIGWRPDKKFFLELIPANISNKNYFTPEFIKKILEKIALSIRIESGEKLKFQSLEKFNNKNLNSVGNENKLKNDFASLSNYFKESSKAKDKEKTQNIDLFIKTFINKVSFLNTKKVFEDKENQFLSNPEILMAFTELSKNSEFEYISLITKLAKSQISKTFECQKIAYETTNEVIAFFQAISNLAKEKHILFVNEFNKNYDMQEFFDIELALILSNSFRQESTTSKTIFEDPDRYNLVFNTIMKYVNPKKGPKFIIAMHVRELLIAKGYL